MLPGRTCDNTAYMCSVYVGLPLRWQAFACTVICMYMCVVRICIHVYVVYTARMSCQSLDLHLHNNRFQVMQSLHLHAQSSACTCVLHVYAYMCVWHFPLEGKHVFSGVQIST